MIAVICGLLLLLAAIVVLGTSLHFDFDDFNEVLLDDDDQEDVYS